jgi:polysaccharide export outer membrane protein
MRIFKTYILGFIATLIASTSSAQSEYQVRAGDTLVIEVLEDTSLNRAIEVLSDGRINFPFAGNIRVAGRSVGQVQAIIANGISDNFATAPNVFVSVQPAEIRQRAPAAPIVPPTMDIFFLGEVNSTGMVSIEPGTRFLQAMASSGGLTRFAADKRIQLRRTNGRTGRTNLFEINYSAILDGADIQNNIVLEDGDVIIVPERRLFE